MSLAEPLLTSVQAEAPAPAKPLTRGTTKVGKKSLQAPPPATLFEELLATRENEGIWVYFRKERQNIKEIEVLDLLISRLSHHTDVMGDMAQSEYKVIARLRNVGVELQEFSKRLQNIPVLQMFIDDIEAVKGLGPLPTTLNMKNFLYAVNQALDTDIKLGDLDNCDDLDAVDPEAATRGEEESEDDDDDENDGSAAAGSDGSGVSDCNEKNEDDEDDEHRVKPADLMAKYNAKQMRNELRQLGGDHTSKATAEELAEKLAEALNRRQMQTLGDFSSRWWDWKGKKVLQDAEIEVVQKFVDDVSTCVSGRLESALTNFEKFPICEWFASSLLTSLQEENHFGILQFSFEIDDSQYSDSLPEGMPWTQLGVHTQAAIQLRLLDEVAVADCVRDFSLAIADIHSKVLPAFILKLTRLKAIMASQVVTTDQMRNKILAGAVTAAMALMSVGMHLVAKSAGVDDGAS